MIAELSPKTHRIGFIGLGVMGISMATHILNAGYRLTVSTRSKAKAQPILDLGAAWADTPAELAANSDVVCSIVGFPSDVESVWLGQQGILTRLHPGGIGIDLTTSSPSLAQRIADAAKTKQIAMLDAPVSGGDIGAREARLSIMVGGEVETLTAAKPLLMCMGKTVVYQGTHGSGQHCKMANQIAIAANMMGVCEAIHYAQRSGLNAQTVLDSISGGAAASWSLSNLAPRMLQGNFAPGFYVKHFRKDLGIALDEVRRLGLNMPGLSNAARLYQELDEHLNGGDQGTQALLRWYAAQV